MKITVVGAADGEVTGSAYYVQTKEASVMVDCGLFQGGKKSEALNHPPTTPKQRIDAVLTHGEDELRQMLAQKIQQRFKLQSTLPGMGDVIELQC